MKQARRKGRLEHIRNKPYTYFYLEARPGMYGEISKRVPITAEEKARLFTGEIGFIVGGFSFVEERS